MLAVDLQGILVLSRLHQGIGEAGNRAQIVVNRQQLARNRSRIREPPNLQVGLE